MTCAVVDDRCARAVRPGVAATPRWRCGPLRLSTIHVCPKDLPTARRRADHALD